MSPGHPLGVWSDAGRPTAAAGVVSLAVAKSLDATTTLVGLSFFKRLEEGNPIARHVFQSVGVTQGLLWSSLVFVLLVTVVTEMGVLVCSRRDRAFSAVRYVGYGTPAVASVVAAVYNTVLIARLCL